MSQTIGAGGFWKMLITVIMFLTILFLPRLLILATDKAPFLNTLGSVFLCYLAGLLLSFAFKAAGANISLASDFSSVLICIGMPLILFSADLPALKKLAKPMLISFTLGTISVIVIAAGAFFVFRGFVPYAVNISGMLIGTYTGGTPNMFAIGNALGSGNDQILLLQTSDMIGGGSYFFLLVSVLPGLLKKVLPPYKSVGLPASSEAAEEKDRYTAEFSGHKQKITPFKAFLSRAGLVGLAVLCFAAAAGICLLLPSKYGNTGLAKLSEYTAVIMLVVTTGGVAFSCVKKIRNAHGSYSTGQYFILMFSVVMGLSFDVSAIGQVLAVLGMLAAIQYGTVLLHLILAKFWKIDYHTMMITSTAGVFGPAFIIPVAKALKNDEIILPGILCGILGYVIGNYLGIGVANLLRLLA
jgi:uncharacterized membrane protein